MRKARREVEGKRGKKRPREEEEAQEEEVAEGQQATQLEGASAATAGRRSGFYA